MISGWFPPTLVCCWRSTGAGANGYDPLGHGRRHCTHTASSLDLHLRTRHGLRWLCGEFKAPPPPPPPWLGSIKIHNFSVFSFYLLYFGLSVLSGSPIIFLTVKKTESISSSSISYDNFSFSPHFISVLGGHVHSGNGRHLWLVGSHFGESEVKIVMCNLLRC